MVFDKSKKHEIKCEDSDGNIWRICMMPMGSKTNRFQLSFFFNEKEFELSKLQSNRSAEDMWDLLSRIRKTTFDNENPFQRSNTGLNFQFLKEKKNEQKQTAI